MRAKPGKTLIILILGAMNTISPFSIDLYLPAFPQIAASMNASVSQVSLSIASYFLGMAIGQIFYGPVMDRYGRKRPLYAGLILFILASSGCAFARTVPLMVALRFLQALGGCAAQVGSMAMVRDFFHVRESAKIFSLLMLILSVSPLLAPTVGGVIAANIGWPWIFLILAIVAILVMTLTALFLPEGHTPDATISLSPGAALSTYMMVLREPQFYAYALSGALSFAGLLVYVAGSPLIFMNVFHVSARLYAMLFAALAVGFIGSSQLNILLSRKFRSPRIFNVVLSIQCAVATAFLVAGLMGWLTLPVTFAFIFCCLACLGLTYPNAAALALAPFAKNAGSASALLGFLQIGVSGAASACIGLFNAGGLMPVVYILAGTTWLGFLVLILGRRNIAAPIETDAQEAALVTH